MLRIKDYRFYSLRFEGKFRGLEEGFYLSNIFSHKATLLKRVSHFLVPSRDVTDQTLSGQEKTKLFPPRKSLISDIPAGDGKTAHSFLQCILTSLAPSIIPFINFIIWPSVKEKYLFNLNKVTSW
jgi:hypothetical protein